MTFYKKIILYLTFLSSVLSFQVSFSPNTCIGKQRHSIDCEKIRLFNSSSSNNSGNTVRRIFFQKTFLLFTSLMMFPADSLGMNPDKTCNEARRVVVIGANGQTGFKVVTLLHKSSQFEPIAMIRDASQSSKFDEMGISYFVHDLESSSIPTQSLEGAHTEIFSAGAGR